MTRAALFLGLTTFAVYAIAPQRVQSDSLWSVPLALTLVQDGTLTLDRYAPTCTRVAHGCSSTVGHLRAEFPVAASLLAAIPLGLFESLVHAWPWPNRQFARWEEHAHAVGDVDLTFFDVTENLIASGVVALAVVFFFLSVLQRVQHVGRALFAASIFAFSTALFSTASRVLWQHGPALLFASIALGASLGAAWVSRPTMALFGAAMLWAVFRMRRAALPWVVLGGALVVGCFFALNLAMLGNVLPPYFAASRLDPWSSRFFVALAGNVVSPGRGLLLFTPVLLLIPFGYRAGNRDALDTAMLAWLGAHWLAISAFPHWWGGHAFGPRLWTETMLGACWLLVPLLAARVPRVLAVLAALSLLIHTRGATSYVPWRWNGTPVNVDDAPERLWDWSDVQFLRATSAEP